MSRFLAARDFLAPAGRTDVCLALEEAAKGLAQPSPLVRRTFIILSMWPMLVECHALAIERAPLDLGFYEELLATIDEKLGVHETGLDPLPQIAIWAGEVTGHAYDIAAVGGAPIGMAKDCAGRFGFIYGTADWMRVDWHHVDPDGSLVEAGHRELKRAARRLLANAELPSGRRERVVAVATALVDLVALKRMRDAA